MLTLKKKIQHIIFDCDSTLVTIEGINELADLVGKKAEISELTRKAMDGEVPLESVFFKRIDAIRPTYQQIKQIGNLYIKSLSNNAKTILEVFQFLGKEIYIMSSGYLDSLQLLARYLQIKPEKVFGVDLVFDQNGNYLYCPRDQILTLSDGKLRLVRKMNFPYKQTAMIGDGANDLSVSEAVKTFIGYQGEKENKFMQKHARIFLQGNDLLPILSLILTKEEQNILTKTHFKLTIQKSLSLLAKNTNKTCFL